MIARDALQQLLDERHSCRGFRPEQVPQADVDCIFTMANRAPSWCNAQPWQVAYTRGEATEAFRETLYRHARENDPDPDIPGPIRYSGAHDERRRAAGYALYASLGIERTDRRRRDDQAMENFRFFGAPHVAVVSVSKELGPYGVMDCGGFVTALVLAAQSLGVATVVQGAIAQHSPLVRSFLDIPEDQSVVCGIAFGYADRSHPANNFRTDRAPLPEVLRTIA
ncbi:MAG: nitroreductase [Hyphomicrobiales bacterium]|jgi:nitroreductase|nr:MAG: nitroreductase [Hyphomicrobiales bacterium]